MGTCKGQGTQGRLSAGDDMIKAFKGLSDAWPCVVDFHDPVNSIVPPDEPLFVPRPPTVFFSDYEPHQVLSATLYMRNQDKSARRIKVVSPNSSLFSVSAQNLTDKVAPGMEAQFTVVFRPPESRDYAYDVMFCTDRESFKVPVRALGARPKLQVPDVIDFGGSCPCNSTSNKAVLARNIGRCAGKFQLSATPPFHVVPSEAFLDVGETVQCLVKLNPGKTGSISGTLVATARCGVERKVALLGTAVNVDVTVTPTEVSFLNTFVTKTTQRAFKIMNYTSQAIAFSLHCSQGRDSFWHSSVGRATSMSGCTAEGSLPNNPDFGTDEISAFPVSGVVSPRSHIEVMLKFAPLVARTFVETCFIAVEGQANRQPVKLSGVGLGPRAIFSYDLLDVGDVYIRTLYRYSVLLENRGDIPVPFGIVSGTSAVNSMFKFSPSSGTVEVNETLSIQVEVMANQLGRFDERIPFAVAGTDTQLMLQFKGRIVGPTCRISTTTLNYGVVAYGFRYAKEVTVENTSDVPMPFSWRLETAQRPQGEFNMIPAHGAILPGAQQIFLIEFIPQHICKYNVALVLDMPGVQADVLHVGAAAECVVPKLHISTDTLEFGECPLEYPCTMAFIVSNKAKLPVKFIIDEQDPAGLALAEFCAEPQAGGVVPQGEQLVKFTLRTKRLGTMQLPCRIQAVGSSLPPLDFVIAAKSVGPEVTCCLQGSSMDVLAAVAFGRIPVMQTHEKTLCLKNTSLISAEVKVFITSKTSVFAVDSRELTISPGGCTDLAVSVRLDETYSFSDLLQILVTNGNALEIPLTAVGIGSTLSCQEISHEEIDFGPQITGRSFSRSILIENHGRRACSVVWQNDALEAVKKKLGRGLRAPNGKQDLSLIPSQDRTCFSIEPSAAMIPAKQARRFNLHGLSTLSGVRRELLQLLSGQDASSAKGMLSFTAVADVDTPQINFSSRTLSFEYLYHPLLKSPPKTRTVCLCNRGKTPLTAAIRANTPFSVIPTAVRLEPGSPVQATISMNHAYRKDLVSHRPRKKLEVTFQDNPHVEHVELHGNISYPNILLSKTTVTFSSTLNDTITAQSLTVTNTCEVPVKYHWDLTNGRIGDVGSADGAMVDVAANELFDIRPIEGLLHPGESESLRINYFAKANLKAHASATMHVQGGPDTHVTLQAMASKTCFHLEPRLIKCGLCQYSQTVHRDITIANPSMVPFRWRYNGEALARQSVLTCMPVHGTIQPGENQIVTLKVRPGAPCIIREVVHFEIAHFEPIAVYIHVEGVYTSVALSLPRPDEASRTDQAYRACARLQASGSAVLQRILQKDSKYLKQFQDAPQKHPLPQLDGADLFGTICMAADGLTQIEVDGEADRQRICDLLLARDQVDPTTENSARSTPHNMQPLPSTPGMKKYTKVLCKYSTLPAVTACTYVLDFGIVIKGTSVRRTFRLQNTSTSHGAVSVDKGLLEAFGCTLRPDKLPRLPALPDRSCTDIMLTFNTQAPQILQGNVDFHLPLLVQHGPPVLVNVKADVAVPELTCDSSDLDFGTVISGMARVLTIRLSNPGVVQAEWCVKKPAEAGDLRDWSSFRCDPVSGVVEAHSHTDVNVIFVPQQPGQRFTDYKQDLAIKVACSRTIMLHATGRSFLNKVKIWPKELDLGAVHPAGQPVHGELQLSNPGSVPIEVFAVDYDTQWAEEAAILSAWNGYRDEWGFALLKPRGLREALWEHIKQDVEVSARTKHPGDGVVQGCVEDSCQVDPNIPRSTEGAHAPPTVVAATTHGRCSNTVSEQEVVNATAAPLKPFIAVVSCFQADIAFHQAQLLAERYSVPLTSMDHLILEAGELHHIHSEDGRLFGDMLYDDLIGWEASGALDNEYPQPYLTTPAQQRDDLMISAFKQAVQQSKYAKGFVILGTVCEYSTSALDPLMQAMFAVRGPDSVYIIDLYIDQESAHRRYMDTLSEEERSAAVDRIEENRAVTANSSTQAASSKNKKASSKKARPVDLPKCPPKCPLGIDPMFGERYSQYSATLEPWYQAADGQPPASDAVRELRVIPIDVEQVNPSIIHDQIIGLHFDMDSMTLALPAVQEDGARVPPGYDVQVVRRPAIPVAHDGQQLLSLHTIDDVDQEGHAAATSRWVIQPGCTVRVRVQFASNEVADLSTRLALMTQVGGAISESTVRASCAYPEISLDPKSIFPRTQRKAKAGVELRHCYAIQPGHFDFGPLPVSRERPASGNASVPPNNHTACLKLENNGKFIAHVKLELVSLANDALSAPPGSKAGKAKKAPPKPLSAFSINHDEVCVDVGETKAFELSCFPVAQGPVEDALRITVVDSPLSCEFSIIAAGQGTIT